MTASVDRRCFLAALPAIITIPRAFTQAPKLQLQVRGLNHVTLFVSDPKQSAAFYQGLFGLPAASVSSDAVDLRVGSGVNGLGLAAASTGRPQGIDHFCLGIEGFAPDRIVSALAAHGVVRSDQLGAMRVQIRMRGDTPHVYIGDPDGIVVQLQDASYCGGGAGFLGNICPAVQPSPKKGLIAVKGYSHVTVYSTDAARSNAFYREVFGMRIRSYQGPSAPTLAVGPGVEFVMFTGGGGRGAAPRASINHFCLTVEDFRPDEILKTLERYGMRPREPEAGPVRPLRHYISMRMENRGGAKEGTPELYFTDPDGILVQLQDTRYCGGGGPLGDVCPPV